MKYLFPKGHKINLGRKQPDEEKAIRSRIAKEKGVGTFKKGVRVSPDTEFKRGQLATNWNGFKKGHVAWNKGKPALWATGEKSHLYRGGISTYERKLYLNNRRRISKIGNGGNHTLGEWQTLKAQYNWTCPACHRKEPEIVLTEDHIIPLKSGGSDNIDNIQPLCRSCNSTKSTKTVKYERGVTL